LSGRKEEGGKERNVRVRVKDGCERGRVKGRDKYRRGSIARE